MKRNKENTETKNVDKISEKVGRVNVDNEKD